MVRKLLRRGNRVFSAEDGQLGEGGRQEADKAEVGVEGVVLGLCLGRRLVNLLPVHVPQRTHASTGSRGNRGRRGAVLC